MVVVNGMAQLVDNDEIAQMLRKRHQEKAQRNVVRPGTAPPLRTRGTDRQLVEFFLFINVVFKISLS